MNIEAQREHGRRGGIAAAMARPEIRRIDTAQRITAREAWRRLITAPADEREEARAVFVLACERAR